ncbi:MAG: hypothetical protein QE271_12640 [Bacteriovoracaceae bacterium]|nr:hypothetical protein [Bacteriovoracaceae bacterium]
MKLDRINRLLNCITLALFIQGIAIAQVSSKKINVAKTSMTSANTNGKIEGKDNMDSGEDKLVLSDTLSNDYDLRVLREKMDQASVGFLTTSFAYKEPGLMKVNGNMSGIQGRFSRLASEDNKIFAQFNGSFQQGTLKYDGGLFDEEGNTTPYSFDGDKMSVGKFSGFIGKFLEPQNSAGWVFIPQVGLNIYKLTDSDDADPYDYKRTQNYTTIPFRLDVINKYGPHLLRAHLTYHPSFLFSGTNKTDIPGKGTLTFNQDEGTGFEVGADWTFYHFNIGLIYETWDVSRSSSSRGYIEPANQTSFTSAVLSYAF